ncbi:aminopeptidase P family protein [Candidatus Pelagibacter sp.]|nr:aminopeptidase P family protein [Candidatus Pelagibacter sp.]
MIKQIKKFIDANNLDGYIFPKNDNYFTEYSNVNNLAKITNFTGSAGFALILKNKNYLFVDGRYTFQAKKQSGRSYKILEIPYYWPKSLPNIKNMMIGFDPSLFTISILEKYFGNKTNLIPICFNFNIKIEKKINYIYHLNKQITGESSKIKIKRIKKYLIKNKINYLYISASENVNWLLNIRGKDLPNSPLVNCKMIVSDKGKSFLFINLRKILYLDKKKFKDIIFCEESKFFQIISNLKNENFCIDKNTCSVFENQILNSRFKILSNIDPIYEFKSIKNSIEIKNTVGAHIEDGVAMTKFLYWFKNNKKKITEKELEKKLENFRKKSKNYLFPSFDTIAGSGPNGAIIHYKSNNQTNRVIKKNDILLIDSGGQYKWGTTDVTRTTSSGIISNKAKNNFTRVLKGHIAVVTCDIKKNFNGYLIDKLARKPLNEIGLDYGHGTGHGVGFFLNVHEGPQSISKYSKIPIKKGMILSNEPGYYLKNKYGIRIENLIYVRKSDKKLMFENLTYVPIDIDLINFKMLTKKEKNYLFEYHLNVYSKLSQYLNKKEKMWLINLIK